MGEVVLTACFVFIIVFSFLQIGYLSGQLKERKDWNELIDKGILPKPFKKKK